MSVTPPQAHSHAQSVPPMARGGMTLWSWGLLVIMLLCVPEAKQAQAQTAVDQSRAYNVKAVSIYGFGRYVTWPNEAFPTPQSSVVIGIVGQSPITPILEKIAELRDIQGRVIMIREFHEKVDWKNCHILFVSKSVSSAKQLELIQQTANSPVLLVGETQQFAHAGGVANFFIDRGRVRFQINARSSIQRGLTLNAKLLSLGVQVQTIPGQSLNENESRGPK